MVANAELPVVHCFGLPIETIVATPAELAQTFAARLASTARRVQATGRALSLVLPGGSVAETFFPVLALAAIDWTMVEVFWSDERAVRPDDQDSNYRVADELLLRRVAIDRARIHRMEAEAADLLRRGPASMKPSSRRAIGTPPRFDVVLLGVGPDGHVCSLFPGHRALEETARRVVAVTDSPKPPPARLDADARRARRCRDLHRRVWCRRRPPSWARRSRIGHRGCRWRARREPVGPRSFFWTAPRPAVNPAID